MLTWEELEARIAEMTEQQRRDKVSVSVHREGHVETSDDVFTVSGQDGKIWLRIFNPS